MIEYKGNAMRCALKALVAAAVDQGLSLDALCDEAINSIIQAPTGNSMDAAYAVAVIEATADALVRD